MSLLANSSCERSGIGIRQAGNASCSWSRDVKTWPKYINIGCAASKLCATRYYPLSPKSSDHPSVQLLALQVMSFQLSQRPDLPCSIHKSTSSLITILGITARLQATYHMASSLIPGFINWANLSLHVSKCLFPRLIIGNQGQPLSLLTQHYHLIPAAAASWKNTSAQRKELHTQSVEVMMKNNTVDENLKPLVENMSFKLITLCYCKRILKQTWSDNICMQMHRAGSTQPTKLTTKCKAQRYPTQLPKTQLGSTTK